VSSSARAACSDVSSWHRLRLCCCCALLQMVDDAGQVAVLAPVNPVKGAGRSKGQGLTTLIDEAAVEQWLGVTPAQVKPSQERHAGFCKAHG
jgi:hypothetical protein